MTAREEDLVRESYDRVPYPSQAQHHTHPDHLAALAILHGLDAAPPQRCRVLELGCSDGGNLIAMAAELGESAFVGVDLSPRQIEVGRAFAAELGLTNVELQARNITDVDASSGTFDYVICHGVFSWVSPEVQERILDVCRERLAPHGVAYLSYNTYPGWHLRSMIRDMVLFHARGVDDPEEKTSKAFELVAFLADAAGKGDDAHAALMRGTREHFQEFADRRHYVLHEYLEETNAPVYFHELAARAARHGLQYLSEAEPQTVDVENLSPAVADRVRSFSGDRIEREQYVDFLTNRTFRRTLFCSADRAVAREASPARLRRLFVSSSVKPVSEHPLLANGVTESFRGENGQTFSSTHSLAKTTFVALAAVWPRALSFDELLAKTGADEVALADLLGSLHASGVVDLHATSPRCTEVVGRFPRVTELARRQAAAGLLVTNQRNRVLKLDDPIARFLVRNLDGTRDRAALVRLLDHEVASGRLSVAIDDHPIREPHRVPAVLQAVLEHHLRKMAEYALLVG